ncbi:MAG: hypothetical protein OEV30_12950 [Ignavibacteria bacterium]|nr:hypothetical protein [Ignavibacteria bacterium]
MIESLKEAQSGSLNHLIKSMFDRIETFAGGAAQADDITMLALHFKGS